MILLLTLLASFSGEFHRCALPFLTGQKHLERSGRADGAFRGAADGVKSYQTEHFAFWWDPTSPTEAITGTAGTIAPGDSVPQLVRVAATFLEKAWRTYVDTLGYLPPKAYPSTLCFERSAPAGKYPVEFCDVTAKMGGGDVYFGGAYPGGGRSWISLASNLTTFEGRTKGLDYHRDLDGAHLKTLYSVDWDVVIAATCFHELFHAVQFNYEEALDRHGFFEASAVAMESRLVPTSNDYLYFAESLARLDSLTPFPTGTSTASYPHGWFVRSLMDDLGVDVVKAIWTSRRDAAARPPSFLNTMRQVLPLHKGSFDTQLVRNAMRVALTGKRSLWRPAGFAPFTDADQFPVLSGLLPAAPSTSPLPLELGAFQILLDTIIPSEDRLLVWVADQGAAMGWARTTPSGARLTWERGSVRYSPADATRSAWAFANPGNPVALRAYATSEASTSHYRTIAAPSRTSATAGQKLTWTSPGGPVLSGTAKADAQATPLLHVDVWKPSASKDPFAYRVAGGANGHALVLEDADRVLHLSGATLSWPGETIAVAYQGSGDGVWKPLAVSDGAIALGELDLSSPTRILVSATTSTKASVQVPRPNPSRLGESIRFPIAGAKGTERLTILAADGGIVRELHPEAGQTEVVWNLRNRENRTVKPGVYTYVWRGIEGTSHGRLLVAE